MSKLNHHFLPATRVQGKKVRNNTGQLIPLYNPKATLAKHPKWGFDPVKWFE